MEKKPNQVLSFFGQVKKIASLSNNGEPNGGFKTHESKQIFIFLKCEEFLFICLETVVIAFAISLNSLAKFQPL